MYRTAAISSAMTDLPRDRRDSAVTLIKTNARRPDTVDVSASPNYSHRSFLIINHCDIDVANYEFAEMTKWKLSIRAFATFLICLKKYTNVSRKYEGR